MHKQVFATYTVRKNLRTIKIKNPIIAIILFLAAFTVFSEYPEIHRLNRDDPLFIQLQNDIQKYYRWQGRGKKDRSYPPITLFSYKLRNKDDLFTLASGLNIPYDTLSTLNRISNPKDLKKLNNILIPNLPGIFVPLKPKTALEDIMFSWRVSHSKKALKIVVSERNNKIVYNFYLGDRFHPIERAYFLRILFRFPLAKGILSSGYGERISPFTGHPEFHTGIDIAAPYGTDVFAARDGTVIDRGFNKVYGNYIILEHEGGYETIYGHLKEIKVELHEHVNSGTIIGAVGSTGMSTGPHLHFEIRRKGAPTNPVPLITGLKK